MKIKKVIYYDVTNVQIRGIHELISVRKSDDKTIVDAINYLIDVEMEE